MERSDSIGVYVHYPFCRRLCPYCDFAVSVVGTRGIPQQRYLRAVLDELSERAQEAEGRTLATVYFGGGTPSLWPAECLAAVIEAVRARIPGVPREVTLEANPQDCTPARMAAWRDAGINRLSIGVQSEQPGALVTLGRDHNQGDGRAAVDRALVAGFDSLSADFILGVPGAEADVQGLLAAVSGRSIPHLSIYELTIEARTHFGKRARSGALVTVDADDLAERYLAAHHALVERGYEHYEISSYARPGHRAVHNSLYWRGIEYLGLGAGAASLRRPGAAMRRGEADSAASGAVRRTNIRAAYGYMRADGEARIAEIEHLSGAELAQDLLWLGLRTVDGVPAEAFEGRTAVLDRLLQAGLLAAEAGRIRPTMRGFLFHDQVASAIVGGGG